MATVTRPNGQADGCLSPFRLQMDTRHFRESLMLRFRENFSATTFILCQCFCIRCLFFFYPSEITVMWFIIALFLFNIVKQSFWLSLPAVYQTPDRQTVVSNLLNHIPHCHRENLGSAHVFCLWIV